MLSILAGKTQDGQVDFSVVAGVDLVEVRVERDTSDGSSGLTAATRQLLSDMVRNGLICVLPFLDDSGEGVLGDVFSQTHDRVLDTILVHVATCAVLTNADSTDVVLGVG